MNTELTYDQILELLPAYAIGALEPEEMLAVDTYLTHNRALLDRLHEVELAAAYMAYSAPDTSLPASAKSQLLARVQADLTPDIAAPTAKPTQPARSPAQAASPDSPESWWAGFRGAFGSVKVWATATACALIAVAALGLYLSQMQTQLGALQSQVDQLQITQTELEQTNASLQQQLLATQNELQQAGSQLDSLQTQTTELQAVNTQLQQTNETLQQQTENNQELLALLSGANLEQTVLLPGTAEAPAANGAFYLTSDNQMLLVLQGLEPLPAEQTYELWLIPADGPPAPAGLLAVQTSRPTWLKLEAPAGAPDFTAVGVSIEPAGGSPAPTGPIVLLGTVASG